MEDEIGRIKIPAWIKDYLELSPQIDVYIKRDYPDNIGYSSLVIHCGACMITRREMLMGIELARGKNVPTTN
ncbi:putative GTP-binding protein [Desulforapulum autotrophicum HRM2]|uniref:GTP-binding protein n=1 Tax=Desulforapulum autotrophicum (strain ATCC 43914 / DSM 3382 / VKM B-1955 / HRM2) TaxID=177437 RepID=C0QH36_DESAH|nr:hypothetical protein [Desulforapulum autotrophicum]ACN15685.1 putative GTP-binding protein [Desulforapulum autotrophicum HRM2]